MAFIRNLINLCLIIGVLAIGLYTYWALRGLPDVDAMLAENVNNPSRYTQVLDRDGQPIYSYGKFQHKEVSLDDVSPGFVQALLATEDRRFYQHFGIDPIGIIRAMVVNITKKQLNEGASTITQQVVRNIFLTNERSYKRKLREIVLSFKLEQRLSKDEILTLYLNNVYLGEGTYGIAAASDVYFHKSPSQLTIAEGALIAGLPQAPSTYNPFYNLEKAIARRNEVLENMREAGYLTMDEVKTHQAAKVRLNPLGKMLSQSNQSPYFNQMVMNQVREFFGLDEQSFWQSGLKIYTTLDTRAQKVIQRAVVENGLLQGSKTQVAAMMLDAPSGGILAYVGGKQYRESQFDRAANALRPPGSLFKVFTYTAAMESGFSLDQVYMDEPTTFNKYTPKNYDGKHQGAMTLAKAFVTSNNVVAVKLLNELGPPRVISVARRMGIKSRLEENLSLTLGSSALTLWDATGAVAVLASQGKQVEPYAIEKITDRTGHEVYRHYPPDRQILDQPTVEQMQALMQATVQYGTGRAANIGRPAAGKTGTSDKNRDGWFIGFTPNVTLGVWMGRDDNSAVSGLTGGGAPAQLWAQVMRGYHGRSLRSDFGWQQQEPLTEEFINYIDVRNLAKSERPDSELLEPSLLDEDGNPIMQDVDANGVPPLPMDGDQPDSDDEDKQQPELQTDPSVEERPAMVPVRPPVASPPPPLPVAAPRQHGAVGYPAVEQQNRSNRQASGPVPNPTPRVVKEFGLN